MAGEYWDVGMWKETLSGKNFFIKLGSAKQNEDGGFTCFMDALPIPGPKGGCRVTIKPQQQRGDRQISSGGERHGPDALDETVPF